jgi:uncharacterized membrane protein
LTVPLITVIREIVGTLRASPLFALALLVTIATAAFNGVMVSLMVLEIDLPGPFSQMTHFQEPGHRVHDLTFAFIFLPAVVGILAQFRRPSKNVANQVMALIPSVGLLLTLVLANNTRVLQPPWVNRRGSSAHCNEPPPGRAWILPILQLLESQLGDAGARHHRSPPSSHIRIHQYRAPGIHH